MTSRVCRVMVLRLPQVPQVIRPVLFDRLHMLSKKYGALLMHSAIVFCLNGMTAFFGKTNVINTNLL